jgi:ribonuclease HI
MATVLTAKYRTRCSACAQPIQPGERMALLGERGSGQWAHAACHPSGDVSAAGGAGGSRPASASRAPASAPRRERARRPDMAAPEGAVEVFTDGACSGNPGPGGWAWAVADGRQGSGGEATTTNQRMELRAVLEALRALDGPLVVVSDSTYVVNCFRDEWWKGWQARGWRNSAKQPVANRDLWEPLVELVTSRGDVSFRWVKGHSGDAMNDLVDQLAVAAAATAA